MIAVQRKAIFLDRDGVINEDHGYVYEPSQLDLFPDLAGFIAWAKKSGFLVLVITNQSGVARGKFNLYDVLDLHRLINRRLRAEINQGVDAFYICPHFPDGIIPEYKSICTCRKPGTSLVIEAASAWHLDLEQSWMIGDKDSDIQCALQAKVRPILLKRGTMQKLVETTKNVPVVQDLAAVRQIIDSRLR